jgi:hypothetical protein
MRMMRVRVFVASGLWGLSILFSFLEDLTMALGNRIVGIKEIV